MRIEDKMSVVYCRQYAPAPIHLRIIPIDLRDDQEDRCQEQREGKSGYHRIGGDIQHFKGLCIVDILEDLLW